jgi:MFS family permease
MTSWYGTAAALVFNKLFFPSFDPFVGTLAAFGSYAVRFVARPLGGAIFGHFGDKIGRKIMLMLTMMIMGAGAFLIGCLPTYKQISVCAPIWDIRIFESEGFRFHGRICRAWRPRGCFRAAFVLDLDLRVRLLGPNLRLTNGVKPARQHVIQLLRPWHDATEEAPGLSDQCLN